MFGKIFSSIYDGTLGEDWRALITFQQFIILANKDGIVDKTPTALSRHTGIPIEHIKAGIEILESDDTHSRTPDHNGKRIIRLDDERPWGWYIVNHQKYREIRSEEDRKEYMRNYMKERREKEKNEENQQSCKQEELTEVNSKQKLTKLANTYASASVSVLNNKRKRTIPGDFCLTEDLIAYAAKKGITNRKKLENFTEGFVLSCQAKQYKYANFGSAWKNWLRKEIEKGTLEIDPPIATDNF